MSRKGARPTVFVCSSVTTSGDLLSKIITASSPTEAISLFFDKFSVQAKEVLGPFYKKRTQILEQTRTLKFSNNPAQKAIYNDWLVNAFLLSEPENQAYLVFIKRVDDKKVPLPKGTITANISELRFLHDK